MRCGYNSLYAGQFFMFFCSNLILFKNSFRNTISLVSKGLDPDRDRPYVGPDLGPSCLQRLLIDVESLRTESPK